MAVDSVDEGGSQSNSVDEAADDDVLQEESHRIAQGRGTAEPGAIRTRLGRLKPLVTLPGPGRFRGLLIGGLTVIVALGGVSAWLGFRVYQADHSAQSRVDFVRVGKEVAVDMTTIDYEQADSDVQRILDSAAGEFYDDFKNRSGPFIEVVKQAQSKSVGTVTEAGLESTNGQQGEVLVAVTVNSTSKGRPQQGPRYWRMRMTVSRYGNDLKVSKVAFVP
jgi:Mce-associated membrane protein